MLQPRVWWGRRKHRDTGITHPGAGRRFALGALAAHAKAEPIKIGFAKAMTGGLAAIGRSGILATQLWAEGINARGGLLGRPI